MPSPPDFADDFRAGLITLLRWRRDVRRFEPTALPEGKLERLLELASIALRWPQPALALRSGRQPRAAHRR
ncbi:hypothetical protein NKI66_19960 [Mesorhizobium sp. M0518]|uniref:hypothetical protein n=1 Tax=Mesorhizobium sp. M0518 TaxID=2956956 RepID=UPI0033390942